MDFQLVDFYDEKQDQILTGNGKCFGGSLRVIRNGIGVSRIESDPLPVTG